jgi:hypothetical protein
MFEFTPLPPPTEVTVVIPEPEMTEFVPSPAVPEPVVVAPPEPTVTV